MNDARRRDNKAQQHALQELITGAVSKPQMSYDYGEYYTHVLLIFIVLGNYEDEEFH